MEAKGDQYKWRILNGGSVNNTSRLNGLKQDLIQEVMKQNIFLEDFSATNIINMKLTENKVKVEQKLKELKESGYQLVVVVLSNDKYYQVVKKHVRIVRWYSYYVH